MKRISTDINWPFVKRTSARWVLNLLVFVSLLILSMWVLGGLEEITANLPPYEGDSVSFTWLSGFIQRGFVSKLGIALSDICVSGSVLFLVAVVLKLFLSKVIAPPQANVIGQSSLEFPQIDRIDDLRIRNNARRAVKNLTLEMVDMGLFHLGKIFEEELHEFLSKAKEKDAFPIYRKDLNSTNAMINCIERNNIQIINHSKYLNAFHYLREERNKRAHGKTPSLAERQKLLRQAGFLGDLYLDSIIALQEHRKKL